VPDFSDTQQISSRYLPELRALIPKALGLHADDNHSIDFMVFWHPMLRGEGDVIQPRSESRPSMAGVDTMVHMDTDVGAYGGLDGILDLVTKNRILEHGREETDWTSLADHITLSLYRPVLNYLIVILPYAIALVYL
jgi:hypothetical protein